MEHPEYGEVLQLTGDQRQQVRIELIQIINNVLIIGEGLPVQGRHCEGRELQDSRILI